MGGITLHTFKRFALWLANLAALLLIVLIWRLPANSLAGYATGALMAFAVSAILIWKRNDLLPGRVWRVLWFIGVAFFILGGMYGIWLFVTAM